MSGVEARGLLRGARGLARVACLVAILLAVVLAGCGGSDPSGPVVASVGDASIGRAAVSHWARVLAQGGGSALGWSHGDPRSEALSFLISAEWLRNAAKEQQVAPTKADVDRKLADREEANGHAEFEHELALLGESAADVRLELETELASEALRGKLLQKAEVATPAAIADYYQHHREHFFIPETRVTDLIERIPTRAAALAMRSRLDPGAQFKKRSIREMVKRPPRFEVGIRDNGALLRAIFQAKIGTIAEPVSFNHAWVLFVVRRVEAPYISPLRLERGVTERIVIEKQRKEFIHDFLTEYVARWKPRTHCKPGYVVQKCAEYTGPETTEENPFALHS